MRKLLAAFLSVTLAVSAPLAALAGSASLILDARTGKVLASENADMLNHPASLTKMMTLYLTFEALKRGKINWDTPIKMSKYAAARPPTKLGVKAGRHDHRARGRLWHDRQVRQRCRRRHGREARRLGKKTLPG